MVAVAENSRLGQNFLDAGSRQVEHGVTAYWYRDSGRCWLRSAAECTQDPMGFVAGDTNLSRYVGNAPVNLTDPSGLVRHINYTPNYAGGSSKPAPSGLVLYLSTAYEFNDLVGQLYSHSIFGSTSDVILGGDVIRGLRNQSDVRTFESNVKSKAIDYASDAFKQTQMNDSITFSAKYSDTLYSDWGHESMNSLGGFTVYSNTEGSITNKRCSIYDSRTMFADVNITIRVELNDTYDFKWWLFLGWASHVFDIYGVWYLSFKGTLVQRPGRPVEIHSGSWQE